MKRKFMAIIAAAVCLLNFAACSDEKNTSDGSSFSVGENGLTEMITPEEGSQEYELGSYRVSEKGTKFYYDGEQVPDELMFALENYFMSFQNKDFEAYKNSLAFDYAERYEKYLQKDYGYGLDNSFNIQCDNIRDSMKCEITGEYDASEIDGYSGDFTITRIKADPPELAEGETVEDRTKEFFSYLDEIFEMDYYEYIKEQADDIKYLTFYIIADGEDGEEHRIISGVDIVFAEKDGKYYTFG